MRKLLNRYALREHQSGMLRYAKHTAFPALFVDMRLGKTLVAIRRFARLERVLVVAPYSALYGWREQLATEGISSKLIAGSREERLGMLGSRERFSLLNKEGHAVVPEIASMHWDAVILDESTFIKNPQSAVSVFYCANFREVRQRCILTGTPAPENELEYFQQLYFLNPGILGIQSYWEFRARYFIKAIDDEHLFFISKQGREHIGRRLAESCYFLKRKDVGLGGEKIYRTRSVILPAQARKVYARVEKEFVLEVGTELKETIWATQRFIWLRRLCGGSVEGRLIHNEKLKALADLLDGELAGEQVIIWADFIEEIALISSMLGCCPVYGDIPTREREQIRLAFQGGRQRFFVAQPGCFRHGTDLSAASTMIYYSSPLGRETREQTEDRFVNLSKEGSLLIIDIIVEGTVDEDIQQAMRKKYRRGEIMQAIVTAAQRRINGSN